MSDERQPEARIGNLQRPLSLFIGRKQELELATELLANARLLTMTGAGGAGKTRLALQLAEQERTSFPEGIWMVELASVRNSGILTQTVAAAVGIRESSEVPIEQTLLTRLDTRKALLVLDNCEHLLPELGRFAVGLLKSCRNLKILITSRQPLGIPGEAVYPVPPLSLPERRPWRSPAEVDEGLKEIQQSEAVELFISRAQAASPHFELNTRNAPWVAEVCRRLDGLPLAIELAAAHTRTFSPRQLAEWLEKRSPLGASQPRVGPPRHQTMEATLDWSYDLLMEEERLVFQSLAVFVDGWHLKAAEAVCSGQQLKPGRVMALLVSLVDKSLIFVEGEDRYRYLEPVRQYAAQKLNEAGRLATARNRHLTYFLEWAEAGTERLIGAGQDKWLERFEIEHDNLRAALDWAQVTAGWELQGIKLALACARFWRIRGYLSEGRAWLEAALSKAGTDLPPLDKAWSLMWIGNLAYLQSDYAASHQRVEQGLIISRNLGDEGRAATALGLDLLGELATETGDYDLAPRYLEKALGIYQELGDELGQADMLLQLGWAAMRSGNYSQAEQHLGASKEIFEARREVNLLALVLSGLGELAIRQGDLQRANALLKESLALRRDLGHRWGIATTLGSLGWAAMLARDYDGMRSLLAESLAIRLEINDRGGIAWCLEKLAQALIIQADLLPDSMRRRSLKRASRLFGAAEGLRQRINSVIDPADQEEYRQIIDGLKKALGQRYFEREWDEGRRHELEEIIHQGLSTPLDQEESAALSEEDSTKIRFGGLSPRERQTAALIAQGNSNREIAQEMVVREKTVETYVTRILNKLGYDSRVQIATWALGVGLVERQE